MSFISKVKSVLKELLMIWNPRISHNLILNDAESAKELNKKFHTTKYTFLPDPFFLPSFKVKDIRYELSFPKGKKSFLLFGSLSERRGVLEVMKSIELLSSDEKNKYHFVFAGRITEDIKEAFYILYNKLKDEVSMTLIDQFCSYELINNLCYSCDVILATHKKTSLSSGVIGYAAHYRKPVIGPSKGLIGKLIRKYEIGYQIDNMTPEALCKAYSIECVSGEKASIYEIENNIEAFNLVALDI